jgi:hypothetical protein
MALTKFAVGTRVTVNGFHDGLIIENREGVVVTSDIEGNTLIRFDEAFSDMLHSGRDLGADDRRHWYFEDGIRASITHSTRFNGLDALLPAPESDRPRFMTAWIVDGDDAFTPTGDAFKSLEAAEAFAEQTLRNNLGEDQIAVFEIRSVHLARLTVTKEVA